MFESEVEMEKRSSIMPLLLMLCLLVAILGLVTYVVLQIRGNTPLSAQDANRIVTATLQGPGPAVTHFRTGTVKTDEKVADPNYRLLEKAGIIKLGKTAKGTVPVSLTADGERLLDGVPGLKKTKDADGNFLYEAPLAQRQLVSIASVNTNGDNAVIEYNWKWVPNQLGDVFDAGGPLVKGFNMWERQALINKYQADFYHGTPAKSTLALARYGKGWKVATQFSME